MFQKESSDSQNSVKRRLCLFPFSHHYSSVFCVSVSYYRKLSLDLNSSCFCSTISVAFTLHSDKIYCSSVDFDIDTTFLPTLFLAA